MDKAETFRQILNTLFERHLPNNGDSMKLGNVTFTNTDDLVWHDLPAGDWDCRAIAEDVVKLIESK